jgi:3-methyladenine DNA glycosylase AlkD
VPVLHEWSVGEDMWLRRSAILAQVHRKADTDFALLVELIEPNRGEREFFIRKAIGWALREYSKTDPAAVVAYCESHELSGLSRREALKRIAVA